MNVIIETMIDDGTEGAAWGLTPEGNPVLAVWKGGKRARIELSTVQAKDIGCGAIYTATLVEQQRAAARGQSAASAIVTPDGRPIVSKH